MKTISFLVDENLLGLARKLRMLGFDTKVMMQTPDVEILAQAQAENRMLLTKDREFYRLLEKGEGYWVEANPISEQIKEVVEHFHLRPLMNPMIRCLDCNSIFVKVDKEAVKDRVEEKTYQIYTEFFECPTCRKVFWEGSHFQRMQAHIDSIL